MREYSSESPDAVNKRFTRPCHTASNDDTRGLIEHGVPALGTVLRRTSLDEL